MQIIADNLRNIQPILHINETLELNLISAKVFDPDSLSFESGYIYIGKSESILACKNLDSISALLCIGDVQKDELTCLTNAEFIIANSTYEFPEVFNIVQGIFDRHNLWDASLNTAILNKKSLQILLDIGYELLDNPIALLDTAQVCLEKSGILPENYEETVWLDIIKLGYVSIDRFSAYDQEYLDSLVNSKNAYIIKGPHHNNYNQMICNIFTNGVRVANFGLVDIIRPFTYGQLSLVNYLAAVFAIAIKLNKTNLHALTNLDYIILRLISGNIVNRNIVQFQLSGRNWKLDDRYYLFIFDPFNNNRADIGTDIVVYYDYLINAIRQTIPGSIVLKFKDSILVVMRELKNGTSLEDVLSQLTPTLDKIHCHCGISTHFHDFCAIYDYYKQAVAALTFGRASDDNKRIFHYTNYFLDHVIDLCSRK
jgi:hypothetical protein